MSSFNVKVNQSKAYLARVSNPTSGQAVRANQKPNYTIEVNDQNGVFLPAQTGTPFVTPNVPLISPQSISELSDVIQVNPSDNATLVFDIISQKYIVKMLNIDGGIF